MYKIGKANILQKFIEILYKSQSNRLKMAAQENIHYSSCVQNEITCKNDRSCLLDVFIHSKS